MHVDLVQVTTRDGFRLDGAYQEPADRLAPAVPVDAFCLLHGTGGSFYSSTLLDAFAERLLIMGTAVLRVNTRGHDGISTAVTPKGGRRQGAAYEVVDDCRHDIAAWLSWLRQRAGPRIVLLGHSSGAVKALYALAQEPQIGAAGVVALSPPRLSYSWFCSSPEGPAFLATYTEADRLAGAGQGLTLLDVKLPLPFVITAAGFVEKYGSDERYNYLRYLGGVPCPTLVTLGGVEVANNMAFRGTPEAVQELALRYKHLQVETIAGADHFYSGVQNEVLNRVEIWLGSILL